MHSIPFLEFDVRKKDTNWVNKVISGFRNTTYKRILDTQKCTDNRNIISCQDDIEFIKNMFNSPEKMEAKGYVFANIAIMERFKNIIIAEGLQQEIKAYVDAQDPSLIRLKNQDKYLLINKTLIEKATGSLYESTGLPKKKIDNDSFNGNYSDFESFAFDPNNPMDINTFFDIFHQLDIEIDFQKIIDHTFKVNNLVDLVPEFREDIMATKMIAYRVFANRATGQMNIRRIQPEKIFRVKGKENPKTQEHDIAVGYYDVITVSEFLNRVGDTYDLMNNLTSIALGISAFNSGVAISGVTMPDGTIVSTANEGENISYSALLDYRVNVGYMEFITIDDIYYKQNKNRLSNLRVIKLGEEDDIDGLKRDGYEIIKKSYQRTYYVNFIDTGAYSQAVINYGRVYLQNTEGSEDEYGSFTIKYHIYGGQTFAEIAKPWIDLASEAFHKFKYLLRKAKEDGTDYNLNSLAEISEKMLGLKGTPTDIKQTFDLFEDSVNRVYAFPKDSEGRPVPIQGDFNKEIKRDFDTKFKSFTEIIDWAVNQIKAQTGINNLRSGESPTTNDVYKLEKASLESSNNVTYYMNYLFDSMFTKSATSILSISMDLIRYEQSLGCKYLKQIVGEEGIVRLKKLPKISPHRMDIFVSSFANYKDRTLVFQDTMIALQNKLITYTDKVLIDSVNDFRKARKLLVNREQAAKIEAQKLIMAEREHEAKMEQMKGAQRLNEINAKGNLEIKKMQVQAEGFIKASQANQEGGISKEQLKAQQKQDEILIQHQLDQQEAFNK